MPICVPKCCWNDACKLRFCRCAWHKPPNRTCPDWSIDLPLFSLAASWWWLWRLDIMRPCGPSGPSWKKRAFPSTGYEGAKRPDNMRLHSSLLGQWNACPHGPEQSVFLPSSPTPCEELAEWRPVTWLFIRSHIRPCCMWNYKELDWEHTSHLQKFDLTAGYYWYWTVCFESLTLHRMRKRGGGALSRLQEMSRVCMTHFFHPFPVHARNYDLFHTYLNIYIYALSLPRVSLKGLETSKHGPGRTQIVGELGTAFYRFKQLWLEEAACHPGAMHITLFHRIWQNFAPELAR